MKCKNSRVFAFFGKQDINVGQCIDWILETPPHKHGIGSGIGNDTCAYGF